MTEKEREMLGQFRKWLVRDNYSREFYEALKESIEVYMKYFESRGHISKARDDFFKIMEQNF